MGRHTEHTSVLRSARTLIAVPVAAAVAAGAGSLFGGADPVRTATELATALPVGATGVAAPPLLDVPPVIGDLAPGARGTGTRGTTGITSSTSSTSAGRTPDTERGPVALTRITGPLLSFGGGAGSGSGGGAAATLAGGAAVTAPAAAPAAAVPSSGGARSSGGSSGSAAYVEGSGGTPSSGSGHPTPSGSSDEGDGGDGGGALLGLSAPTGGGSLLSFG